MKRPSQRRLPMAHPLCLLDSFSGPLARPDANPLATVERVVADPHDGLRAMVRRAHPGLLDLRQQRPGSEKTASA